MDIRNPPFGSLDNTLVRGHFSDRYDLLPLLKASWSVRTVSTLTKETPLKTLFTAILFALTISPVLAQSTAAQREAKAIEALKEQARYLNTQDLSCESVNDCQAMELGSKACGGPKAYLVVSMKNNNYTRVATLATATVDREDAYNRKYRVISDCMMIMPPTIGCVANKCANASY
jgi:hypothetical protein